MAYSDFTTIRQVEKQFGIRQVKQHLFSDASPTMPSERLLIELREAGEMPLFSEKAKSELIITPILNELVLRNDERITFFSGYNFDVDKKQGLKGHVDFMLSHESQLPYIEAPTFCIVEAKNDNLDSGIPQCIAEMYAAQLFNHRRARTQEVIYGTVTSGMAWQFMKLTGSNIVLDSEIYYLSQLPHLIGILQIIVDAK